MTGVLFETVDAGMAILIGDSSHIVEFPSVLLPAGCESGSIVSISCQRDHTAEHTARDAFWNLQESILSTFGAHSPVAPNLRLRNVTQTSVTLEWDALSLATAKLLSLTIWRNGQRLALIPNPTTNTSTKVSGLDLDSPYSFHLVLKTSAGTFISNMIKTKTHSIANTSGIRVCFGTVQPPETLDSCKAALEEMKAGYSNSIQIDTTHFVCTSPNSSAEAPQASQLYQKALQMSIPTVVPSWIHACKTERKLVPIAKHYLGTAATTMPASSPSSQPVQVTNTKETAPQTKPISTQSDLPVESTSVQKEDAQPSTDAAPIEAGKASLDSNATEKPIVGQEIEKDKPSTQVVPQSKDHSSEDIPPSTSGLQDVESKATEVAPETTSEDTSADQAEGRASTEGAPDSPEEPMEEVSLN